MWLAASYQPCAAFTLRSSATTSSGGRTNLVPTMYAVKIALVDAAFRAGEDGSSFFSTIRDVPIRFRPPERAVVSNSFVKIWRESREEGTTYAPTIGFRELCHFAGALVIAFDIEGLSEEELTRLERLLPVVNYFGKRSCFFQFEGAIQAEELDHSYTFEVGKQTGAFSSDLIIQLLDDVGSKATFGAINTFSDEGARVGRDRTLVPVAVPYRRVASSRAYTMYLRRDQVS